MSSFVKENWIYENWIWGAPGGFSAKQGIHSRWDLRLKMYGTFVELFRMDGTIYKRVRFAMNPW